MTGVLLVVLGVLVLLFAHGVLQYLRDWHRGAGR